MLSHEKVWAAIDALAERHGLSVSGLARKAGLDSTAFNKSKRQSVDGRLRWPSTESLAKIMDATGESFQTFAATLSDEAPDWTLSSSGPGSPAAGIPLVGFAQAGEGGFFDDAGYPVGHGWDMLGRETLLPEHGYALQVQGDSMLPLYRHGDRLIVDATAKIHIGDRIVVKTVGGEVMAKILSGRNASQIVLHSLNPDHPERIIAPSDVEFMARIIWASQ